MGKTKIVAKTELEWAIDRAELVVFWLKDLQRGQNPMGVAHSYNRAADALDSACTHFKATPKPVMD